MQASAVSGFTSAVILHTNYAVQMDSNFEFCTRDPHLNYQRLRNLATQYVSSVKSVLKTKRIFNYMKILHEIWRLNFSPFCIFFIIDTAGKTFFLFFQVL